MVGAQDNGTRVREGTSKTFNQSIGGDGFGTGFSNDSQVLLTYGTASGGSYRRSVLQHIPDTIQDWEGFALPTQTGDSLQFSTPIEMPSAAADSTGRAVFTFSSKRAFQLTSGPTTFTSRTIAQLPNGAATPSQGLATFTTRSFRGQAHALGVSPVDMNHVAIAMNAGGLAISADAQSSPNHWTVVELNSAVGASGGRTWIGFNASVQWADNSTIYVSSESSGVNAIRIAKSIDGGATWAAADGSAGSNPLPDGRVNRVAIDPRDVTKQTLLAASDLGVFRSTDGGTNWSPYGNGLPNVRVSDIYMPPDGSQLLAATYGRGVWTAPSLTFVAATLTNDTANSDGDNVLDAGKTGKLNITLHNGSAATLSGVSATATLATPNPNVSFPSGTSISFPAASPNSDVTASIPVALDAGATGIQVIDFSIGYTDSTLNATPTIPISLRANYEEIPNYATTDNLEALVSPWTIGGTATNAPDIYQWQLRQIGPQEHRFSISNSRQVSDQTLTSPVMHVGSGPFVFSYEQRHSLENGFDGMALEISVNGGAFQDVGAANLTPTYATTPLPSDDDNPLIGRQVFTGRSANYPSFVPVTANLGTQYANQDVRLRFRVATDTFGFGTGIEVRNFAASGITNTPFTAVVPHCPGDLCATTATIVSSKGTPVYNDSVTLSVFVVGATGGEAVSIKEGSNVL